MGLPQDIVAEVSKRFSKPDLEEVLSVLQGIKKESLNVGNDQLIRCLILLSERDLDVIKDIQSKKYWGDPRDVISVANDKFPDCNFGLSEFKI